MAEHTLLREEAQWTEARIFSADEAHFRADAELRGKRVLKGQSALVDSNQPEVWGEGQSLFGCVPGDRRGGMDRNGRQQQQRGASVSFLTQLRERHPGPLRVIWDNAPAYRGEEMRGYLRTPGLS